MEKEIKNIVFYTFESETGERTQACVFYTDGTVKNTNEEEGVEDVITLMKSKGISPKEYKRIINKHYVYKTTGEDLEEYFEEYLTKKEKYTPKKDRNIKTLFKNLFKRKKGESKKVIDKEEKKPKTVVEETKPKSEKNTEERKEKFWRVLQTITGVTLVNKLKKSYSVKKAAREEANKSKPKKQEGKLKKWFNKTFVGKITRRVAALLTAAAILFIPGCSKTNDKGAEQLL